MALDRSRRLIGAAVYRPALVQEPRVVFGAPPLRCASLLKPLLFWAAGQHEPFRRDPSAWARLAESAVVLSANQPTTDLWDDVGEGFLLATLHQLTGVEWTVEPGGVRSFGRVLVRAEEVTIAYATMAGAAVTDPAAAQVFRWMEAVPARQTFGVRACAAAAQAEPESAVGIKCGWYCDTDEDHIRTHAVTISGRPEHCTVTCVLTALPIPAAERKLYAEADARGEEIAIHERHAGALLRETTLSLLTGGTGPG